MGTRRSEIPFHEVFLDQDTTPWMYRVINQQCATMLRQFDKVSTVHEQVWSPCHTLRPHGSEHHVLCLVFKNNVLGWAYEVTKNYHEVKNLAEDKRAQKGPGSAKQHAFFNSQQSLATYIQQHRNNAFHCFLHHFPPRDHRVG